MLSFYVSIASNCITFFRKESGSSTKPNSSVTMLLEETHPHRCTRWGRVALTVQKAQLVTRHMIVSVPGNVTTICVNNKSASITIIMQINWFILAKCVNTIIYSLIADVQIYSVFQSYNLFLGLQCEKKNLWIPVQRKYAVVYQKKTCSFQMKEHNT